MSREPGGGMMDENGRSLTYSTISGAAKLAGVIGWPVAHSLSPRLHSIWLRRYQIDAAYVPLGVRPEDLREVLAALPKLGFQGVNITTPHKEKALPLVHRATPAARRIGAVNTIVVAPDGTLVGSNTDVFGFVENLRETAPDWRPDQAPVVVVGAGGAARAIVFALCDIGCSEVRVVNRTFSQTVSLAATISGNVRPLAWEDRGPALDGASLLVNTTTLGMRNQPALEIDLTALPRDAVVYDIVYTPAETALLADARARGNTCVGGIGMLLHQARPGFAAWFGRMPAVTPDLAGIVCAGLGS